MSLSEAEARKIGASDFPALLGLDEWGGPVALWARMAHGVQGASNADMEAGNAAEDYNRALYRQRTGYNLLGPSKWVHPLYPWLRCSPDDRATTPEGRRLVELKRYNRTEGWGAEGTDVVPRHIWVQVQVQAGVGLDNGEVEATGVDVSALLRGELRLYHVPHVPEVYARCIEVGERFVRDFVRTQRFPEGPNMRLLERDVSALSALFPAPKPTAAPLEWQSLSTEQQATVEAWLRANEARKAWEKEEEARAAAVAVILRDVPGLMLGDGRIDFKAQRGAPRLDVKALREALKDEDPALAKRMGELLEKHTKETTTRPLVRR